MLRGCIDRQSDRGVHDQRSARGGLAVLVIHADDEKRLWRSLVVDERGG
jgi:hypothetical protein